MAFLRGGGGGGGRGGGVGEHDGAVPRGGGSVRVGEVGFDVTRLIEMGEGVFEDEVCEVGE